MRWSSVPVVVVAVLALLTQLAQLAALSYSTYAEGRSHERPLAPATLKAAKIAAQLAPWDADGLALNGWLLHQSAQQAAGRAAYAQALRLSPADPYRWLEWGRLQLGCAGCYRELNHSEDQLGQLAAQSYPANLQLAALGLSSWPLGNSDSRRAWRKSLRLVLDVAPAASEDYFRHAGIALDACLELPTEFPQLGPVCHARR